MSCDVCTNVFLRYAFTAKKRNQNCFYVQLVVTQCQVSKLFVKLIFSMTYSKSFIKDDLFISLSLSFRLEVEGVGYRDPGAHNIE